MTKTQKHLLKGWLKLHRVRDHIVNSYYDNEMMEWSSNGGLQAFKTICRIMREWDLP